MDGRGCLLFGVFIVLTFYGDVGFWLLMITFLVGVQSVYFAVDFGVLLVVDFV